MSDLEHSTPHSTEDMVGGHRWRQDPNSAAPIIGEGNGSPFMSCNHAPAIVVISYWENITISGTKCVLRDNRLLLPIRTRIHEVLTTCVGTRTGNPKDGISSFFLFLLSECRGGGGSGGGGCDWAVVVVV